MEKTSTIEPIEKGRDNLREAQAHRDSALSAFNTADAIFRQLFGGFPADVKRPGIMSGEGAMYDKMMSIVDKYRKDLEEKEQNIIKIKSDMFDNQK